jgi:type I restriction enzyme M protein
MLRSAGDKLAALTYLRWADFHEAEQEAIAAFDDSPYQAALPARLHWRAWHHHATDQLQKVLFHDLVPALEQLGNSRHNPLAKYLHQIVPSVAELKSLPVQELRSLVEWVSAQPFETHQDRRRLLDRLDSILYKSQDKHSGQFFTPPTVLQLLVELAAPTAGERVYDPCFGFAGLLTTSLGYVQRHAPDRAPRGGQPLLQVSGIEINSSSYTIGLTRLALAGIADPQIELGNALERTPMNSPQRGEFDLVIANPPWGGKIDLDGLDYFPIQTSDSAALFIQHAMMQLRPGGRAVIVVPPSILFGSGAVQKVRHWLLEQHTIEAVIGLPDGSLHPYTNITPTILVVRCGGPTRSLRMIDGSSLSSPKTSGEGTQLVQSIVTAFTDPVAHPIGNCDSWTVTVESVSAIGWDLTPKRRDQSSLELILNSLPRGIEIRSLGDVCAITSGRSYRSNDLQETPPLSNLNPSPKTLLPDVERSTLSQQRPLAFAHTPIPYIRIRDVQDGMVSKASSWLGPVAASSAESKWRLGVDDVLLSKSGTIGKAGIVRDGAIGAIAANGFFVLRAEDGVIDPHFLLAYLQSKECRAWMDDRAQGSRIRHLTLALLRKLPIPVPAIQVQQRVAEQHRRYRVDGLSFLAELLSEDRGNPLAAALTSWVDRILAALERRDNEASLEAELDLLEQVASETCPVNACERCGQPYFLDYDTRFLNPPEGYANAIATTCVACWLGGDTSSESMQSLTERSPLVPWASAFRVGAQALVRIAAVSDAAGVLNILQSVRHRLSSTLENLQGHLPNEEKARRATLGLLSVIDGVVSRLLDDVRITVGVTSVSQHDDGEASVIVKVTNESRLPLRDMSFSTIPQIGSESCGIPYQLPAESTPIRFIGALPAVDGPITIQLQWSGRNLNGDRFLGSRELSLQFTPERKAAGMSELELGASPYICGDPVKTDRPDVFVGREELLDQIRRQIMQSGNVVLLEGNRRAGKSSILWHLEGPTAVPGWLGVYCSLQGTEGNNSGGIPTAEVFRAMAYEIVQSVRRLIGKALLPDGSMLDGDRKLGITRALREGISEESPFADFREFLEVTLDSLSSSGLGLLLMLDEFDKLQEGIDKGVTSPQVPENIRFLVQTYPKFSAVLTGSRRLKRLREEYWSALFGLGTRLGVTSLAKDPAKRLVSEPVKGRLSYSQDAIDLVYMRTAGQPYLLQCLCNRVFDIAAREGVRSISVDQVLKASTALVEDNEHFASLWDYTMLDRRRFLLALIHREATGPDLLRLGVLEEKLSAHGVDITEDTLISDLEYLRELELIDLHGEIRGAHYSLTIPMMGDWIERQQDFEALRSRARTESEDSRE